MVREVEGPTPSHSLRSSAIFGDPLVQELLAARLVAVLTTLDPARAIHAVPLWFAADRESVLMATASRSRKVQNLERDSRASLVVHDSRPGFEVCGVSIVGRIDVIRGLDAQTLIDRVHRRYVVEDSGRDADVQKFLASDDVALRLLPDVAFTWDERQSTASEVLRAIGGALPLVPTDPRS